MVERARADGGDVFQAVDGSQPGLVGEGVLPDGFHRFGQGDAMHIGMVQASADSFVRDYRGLEAIMDKGLTRK